MKIKPIFYISILLLPILFVFYSVYGATVFDEQWSAVGSNTYQQDDLIANSDEGNWYCRADADSPALTVVTTNGVIRVNNNAGAPGAMVSAEQTSAPLTSSVEECIIDAQMENGGGSMHIIFENSGTAVCDIEVNTGNDIIDNQANFYNNVHNYNQREDYNFTFDFSAHTFNLEIDGTSIFTGIAFDNNENVIDTVKIERETNQYIDIFSVQMNGDVGGNNLPVIILNNPIDGSIGQPTTVVLNVTVTDSDADQMNVTLYNETWYQLHQSLNVVSGSIVNYTWSSLDYSTFYIWNVNASDGINTTTAQYNFTTQSQDSCTCPDNAGTNWEVNMSDNCILNTNCVIANLTFIETGTFTINAILNLSSVEDLEINQIGYINSTNGVYDR